MQLPICTKGPSLPKSKPAETAPILPMISSSEVVSISMADIEPTKREACLYPAIFSTARLMSVAIIPVQRPIRKATVHFKNMNFNTWTLDLLLQSCLKVVVAFAVLLRSSSIKIAVQ